MMRAGALATTLLLAAATAHGQTAPPYPSLRERLRFHMRGLIGPGAIVSGLAVAGIEQATNNPPQWQQGTVGYARRFGLYYAQLASAEAIGFGVGALLHENPMPVSSNLHGVWPRTWFAVRHTFVVTDQHGQPTPAVYLIAGMYGGAFISNTWYPNGLNGPGDALRRGSWNVLGAVGNSIAREFLPDLKRRVFHKKPPGATPAPGPAQGSGACVIK